MRRLDWDQKGFTLIEAIISLVITGILTLTTFPTVLRLYDYHQLNQAITVLQSDLHYVRDFNMSPLQSDELLSIRIYAQEDRYDIAIGSHAVTHIPRKLPKNVTIPTGYPIIDIKFNTQGNISTGQTLTIESKYYSKNLVFSIGTGGFDIRD